MKLALTILSIFLINLIGTEQSESDKSNLQLNFVSEIELTDSEGLVYQNPLSRFAYSNNLFILTVNEPPLISGYDVKSGEQTLFKNIQGDGPNEIDIIHSTYATDKMLYVINRAGRIVGISLNDSKHTQINTGVIMTRDIIKVNDTFIIANESPEESHYLTSFQKETGESEQFGPEQILENTLLQPYTDSGSMLAHDKSLIITMPFGQEIYRFDASSLDKQEIITLDLPNFMEKSASNEIQVYMEDPELIISFGQENSVITQIIPMHENFLIEVMHMHNEYKRELYKMTDQFELKCHAELPDELNGVESPKVHTSDGNYIYFYREEIHETENEDVKKFITAYEPEC